MPYSPANNVRASHITTARLSQDIYRRKSENILRQEEFFVTD